MDFLMNKNHLTKDQRLGNFIEYLEIMRLKGRDFLEVLEFLLFNFVQVALSSVLVCFK